MADTTYVDYITPAVNAEWLNEVNDHVWHDTPVTGTTVHDASKIAYLPDGISAVPTTVQSKLRESVSVKDFGAVGDGVTDDTAAIQAATDYAESISAQLEFDGSKTYKLGRTLYLGNANWKTNGALFSVTSDASFVQSGSASRKNEGAILTKSAGGAGYGLSAVKLSFDQLRILFSRPTSTNSVHCPFLIENVDGFFCNYLEVKTPDGQATAKTPIDFYSAVRNVRIDVIKTYIRNGANAGGFWIRNALSTADTENINIGVIDCDHESVDECVAIFPFNIGAGTANVRNIRIGLIKAKIQKGHGLSVIDLSGGGYSRERMRNIVIDRYECTIYGGHPTAFYLKADSCAPVINEVLMSLKGLSSGSGNQFCIRGVQASGQTDRLKIGVANIELSTAVASGSLYGIRGPIHVDEANIYSSAGTFSTLVEAGSVVESGQFAATVSAKSCRNVERIGKGVTVYAPVEGVGEFNGSMIIDLSVWSGAILFLHSAVSQTPTLGMKINANITLTGSGTLTQVVNANNTSVTTHVPVDVFLRIKNLNDITLPSNYFGGCYKLTSNDIVNIKSTGAVRITQALSV